MAQRPLDATVRQRDALERGTTEHYQDAWLYDHEYRRRRADVNFYRRVVAATGKDALELGCGSGRVMVPLLRDGHRVLGVDASQPMLRRCADRIARLGSAPRGRALLVRSDFRAFAFSRRWPSIICPFNAMMHLYSRDDMASFLACIKAHLAPGGRFTFDVLNPDLRWLNRDPYRRWARTRFKDPTTGRGYIYTTNHEYDCATQIAWIRIYYDEAEPPDGRVPRTRVVRLAHRQYFPEELLLILEHNGFTVEERVGGFHGEPFDRDSDSQVITCRVD